MNPNLLAHLRREAVQKRHEAALARDYAETDPTRGDAAEALAVAAVLDEQAAEIEARIDASEAVIAP